MLALSLFTLTPRAGSEAPTRKISSMPRALDLPATLKSAEKIRLGMRLPKSSALHASLSRAAPPGIRIVRFGEAAAADKLGWAKTIAAAGDRPTVEAALEQWATEFATFDTELARRMFFAFDETDESAPIGTATAWFYPDREHRNEARVHWVSIVPQAQGRGLAKALLGAVVTTARSLHADAANVHLVTHTQAARAIGMYIEVGFVPAALGPSGCEPDGRAEFTADEKRGWELMREAGLDLPS